MVDDETAELIEKLSKQYPNPEKVAACAEKLISAQGIKIMSGRSYADREMKEVQKKFSQEVINDAWSVKFEVEDRISMHESLNEDLSIAPHDYVITVLGAIFIVALPWLKEKIQQVADAKQLRIVQEETRKLNAKKKMILDQTLRQLKKDKEFQKLFKDVTSNPIEGKEDMLLKGRRINPLKPFEKQPIRKDRIGDYQSMQKNRNIAIEKLQKYLESIFTEDQKMVFGDLLKTYRMEQSPFVKESVDEMPESDKELVKQAMAISNPIDWSLLIPMEEKAVSDEAKKIIRRRSIDLYHREEYDAGLA